MLLLDDKTWEFDGVTVFPDHAQPGQFYYMPLAPKLSVVRDGAGALPMFSLIRFTGEAGAGGFVNFDVDLGLEPARLDAIRRDLEAAVGRGAHLAPLPVVDGSVHLIMLDRDSSQPPPEAGAEPGPTGLRFVNAINHAAKPALYGDNRATFSVELTPEGVTTVMQSLNGVILPIAVVYSLQYLGLRPAYSVHLDIDWKRVQDHMEESYKVDTLVFSSEINNTVDKLVEARAIVFTVDDFTTGEASEADVAGRRDAAIAQVRAMITDAFFQPSLPPWKPEDASGWAEDLKKAADVIALIAQGPAAAQANKSLFSYRRLDYQRTDRKSLNVNFSERVTVRRSIYPQGHLAGLFGPIAAAGGIDRFVTSVNLDDPWFKRRRLKVDVPVDFGIDKIRSINVRARYGNEPKNAILTKGNSGADFNWASRLDGSRMVMPVEIDYEVTFDNVDTTERPRLLASPKETVEDEHKAIDPRALYGMSPIPIGVVPAFPWERYPQVEVHTRYLDPANGLAQAEMFQLGKDSQPVTWTIFVLDLGLRRFEYRLVYRAADHRDHSTDWVTTDEEAIQVEDPFPRKRELTIVAGIDWTVYQGAIVDVVYSDPANGIEDRRSVELAKGTLNPKLSFEMADPTRRMVTFSALIIGQDGSTIEIPASQSNEPWISIKPDMKGRRLVEVRPPPSFPAQHLRRAKAELRFEDFAAGLDFSGEFVFEPGSAAKTFEYSFADPGRARYERRLTFLFENGLQKVVDWQPSDDPVLQLTAP